MNKVNKRIHRIEFTRDELFRISLALRYYFHAAEERDSYQMLVDKEVLTRISKVFVNRHFQCQFSEKDTVTIAIRQIEIDLIWKVMQHMDELRDVLFKIGSKTHSYAA